MAGKLLSRVVTPLSPPCYGGVTVTPSNENRHSAEIDSQGTAAPAACSDHHFGNKVVHTIRTAGRAGKTTGGISASQQQARGPNTEAGSALSVPGCALQTASVRLPLSFYFACSRPSFGRRLNGRRSGGFPFFHEGPERAFGGVNYPKKGFFFKKKKNPGFFGGS